MFFFLFFFNGANFISCLLSHLFLRGNLVVECVM